MSQAQQRPEIDESYAGFPPPRINQVSPDFGEAGDSITITGSHIASVTGCTFQVKTDIKTASIESQSGDNKATVRVPKDMTPGRGKVWVTNESGESSKLDFTVQA